jgi:large subunit ribosomal protein L4
MKTILYNQKGENIGETLLPKEVFDVEMNKDLVWQVVTVQSANRRQVIANTKSRGDVSGGGKKPWRQKGTGRARVGSTRSPLWRHGGITFGPRSEKIFKKNISAGMRKIALFMVLSDKARNNEIFVLDELKMEQPKTKIMAAILNSLPMKKEASLVILPGMDKNLIAATRNIKNTDPRQARELNCLDVLSCKYLVMPKESIKVIKETFGKKEEK